MSGIIGLGQNYRKQATSGLQQASDMQRQREQTNDRIEQQERQGTMNAIGTGASTGMMAGMQSGSVGGPAGALIGAGVGFLADSVF